MVALLSENNDLTLHKLVEYIYSGEAFSTLEAQWLVNCLVWDHDPVIELRTLGNSKLNLYFIRPMLDLISSEDVRGISDHKVVVLEIFFSKKANSQANFLLTWNINKADTNGLQLFLHNLKKSWSNIRRENASKDRDRHQDDESEDDSQRRPESPSRYRDWNYDSRDRYRLHDSQKSSYERRDEDADTEDYYSDHDREKRYRDYGGRYKGRDDREKRDREIDTGPRQPHHRAVRREHEHEREPDHGRSRNSNRDRKRSEYDRHERHHDRYDYHHPEDYYKRNYDDEYYRDAQRSRPSSRSEYEDYRRRDYNYSARMCHTAWSQVKDGTIANCFRKAGFIKKNEQAEPIDEVQDADVSPLEAWDDSVGVTFEEYVKLDENVEVCGEISDKDILAEVLNNNGGGNSSGEGEEEEEEEEEEELVEGDEMPIPSSSEALRHLHEFRRYVEGQDNVSGVVFESLNVLEKFASLKRLNSAKQTDISSFFAKL
ncbi:hypothetical protein C0J52_22653 [Blattella germanica]|nr:hypothetical protein C0J52_22653 [Blattella germanica]